MFSFKWPLMLAMVVLVLIALVCPAYAQCANGQCGTSAVQRHALMTLSLPPRPLWWCRRRCNKGRRSLPPRRVTP